MLVDTLLGCKRSPIATEPFPVNRPGQPQVPAQQNVRMVARLFVDHTEWIGILRGDSTTLEQFFAFIQIEAGDDDRLRLPWVVAAIPEGICQAHGVRQAESGAVEIQRACFTVIPSKNSG